MTSTPNVPHPTAPPAPCPPTPPASGHASGRGPGVFVPQYVLAAAICLVLGVVTGLMVWLAPTVWPPIGAGIAVTGLALTLYGLWRGRHRP